MALGIAGAMLSPQWRDAAWDEILLKKIVSGGFFGQSALDVGQAPLVSCTEIHTMSVGLGA